MDPYELLLLVMGVGAAVAAVAPSILKNLPMSLPIVLVGLGALVFAAVPGLPDPTPGDWPEATERLTELVVLLSLMGAGLAIDRPVGWRRWATTWRLLGITMPIAIFATALLGYLVLDLPLASALLLGAVLAPTDPVLADAVQVGKPATNHAESGTDERHDEVRVSLTSEAGLNDALAFPFVYLAVTVFEGNTDAGGISKWLALDLGYRILIGLVVGLIVGRTLAQVGFGSHPKVAGIADLSQGFMAVAIMLIAYGAAEVAQGYGFLAVFVAAVTLRSYERDHADHTVLHDFTEQVEKLVTVLVLVLLGGALVTGVLDATTTLTVVVAALAVLVVRPVAGRLALIGTGISTGQRSAIAFFGIKGIGSIYYLAYAFNAADFREADTLWATVGATLVVSLAVHGTLATPALNWLEQRRTPASAG